MHIHKPTEFPDMKNGDTLRGFIIDRKDNWAVKSIDFAQSENSVPERYRVYALNAFYLKPYNAYYYSRILDVDKKPIDMSSLEDNGTRKVTGDTVLIQLLAKGSMNLFKYNDEKNKTHFFVQKGEGKIEELPFVRYMANGKVAELHFYQGTLKGMTTDCSKTRTPPTRYEDQPLTEFVKRYNSCFGAKDEYTAANEKMKIQVGVFGGVAFSSGKFSGQAIGTGFTTSNALGPYSGGSGAFAGIFAELSARRASNPSRAGLQLFWQKFPTMTREVQTLTGYEKFVMDFTVVQLGPTYKYIFMTGKKISPYLKAELSAGPHLSADATGTRVSDFSPTTVSQFADFNKLTYSFGTGAGVSIYKRLLVEIRYKNMFFTGLAGERASVNGVNTSLGYLFAK